jgi:hypothetical protein
MRFAVDCCLPKRPHLTKDKHATHFDFARRDGAAGIVRRRWPGRAAAAKAAQVTTQLPRNAAPTHYAVSLTPDAANSSFSASVTIALDVNKPPAA